MNITVINGSPKGDDSITFQTLLYIKKKFTDHNYTVINAGARIRYYEKNFSEVIPILEQSDLILFSYPVYTFLVPSQLHRFIELIKENGLNLQGIAASQITTSKHFYDITAHKFIQENCQDLGMNYIRGLSADMGDLLTENGRKQALQFMDHVEWSYMNNIFEPHILHSSYAGQIAAAERKETQTTAFAKNIVIVADLAPGDEVLSKMISRFTGCFAGSCRIINIHDFPFKGGCLGCMNCVVSGSCIYKDGFEHLLRDEIQTADSIIYAFTVRDHSMGSIFKTFDDRQFCNGHRTVTMGMPVGYLINGDYYNEENLKMVVETRCEVGGNFLAGVGTDDSSIDQLAAALTYALKTGFTQPQNFYGVGGSKIFRDLIYQMQGLMKADHKFFKAHDQYDFPQKKKGTILAMYAVGMLFSNKKLKAKMGSRISEGMIAPYRKILK